MARSVICTSLLSICNLKMLMVGKGLFSVEANEAKYDTMTFRTVLFLRISIFLATMNYRFFIGDTLSFKVISRLQSS